MREKWGKKRKDGKNETGKEGKPKRGKEENRERNEKLKDTAGRQRMRK